MKPDSDQLSAVSDIAVSGQRAGTTGTWITPLVPLTLRGRVAAVSEIAISGQPGGGGITLTLILSRRGRGERHGDCRVVPIRSGLLAMTEGERSAVSGRPGSEPRRGSPSNITLTLILSRRGRGDESTRGGARAHPPGGDEPRNYISCRYEKPRWIGQVPGTWWGEGRRPRNQYGVPGLIRVSPSP